MSIGELIKVIEKSLGLEQSYIKIKNYDIDKDKELLEKQILTFYFEDVYEIKRELITILSLLTNKNL